MRPNNQNKRNNRGRNSGNRNRHNNSNPLTRNYESNGPDVKIRGNAQHIVDKYVQLARDAQNASDSVAEQNYLQHAEHYLRIITAANAQNLQRQQERIQAEAAKAEAAEKTIKEEENSSPSSETQEAKETDITTTIDAKPDTPAKPRVRRPRRQTRIKENTPIATKDEANKVETKKTTTDKMPQTKEDGLPAFLTEKENTDAAQ